MGKLIKNDIDIKASCLEICTFTCPTAKTRSNTHDPAKERG